MLIREFWETCNFIKQTLNQLKIQVKKKNSYTITITYNLYIIYRNYIKNRWFDYQTFCKRFGKTFRILCIHKIYKSISITHNLKYYRINNCKRDIRPRYFQAKSKRNAWLTGSHNVSSLRATLWNILISYLLYKPFTFYDRDTRTNVSTQDNTCSYLVFSSNKCPV